MAVKRHFQVIAFTLLALAAIAGYAALRLPVSSIINKENTTPAHTLPAITFYDAHDQKVTLADFKGKVVLVNLWATWCPPCVVELPALDSLQAKLHDKNFKVVAISEDRSSISTVTSFLQNKGIEHIDAYWDKDKEVPAKWRYEGLPTSFLLDVEGNVIQQFDGPYTWDKGEVFEKIKALLK